MARNATPDEEHAGVGATRGRLGEQEAEREGEGADEHDEPEVRRMVLPDEVVARLGEQDEQAYERDDADRAPARKPAHKRLSSAARYSVPPKSFSAWGGRCALVDLVARAYIRDRVDLALRVHLDRESDRALLAVVEEVGEGDDARAPIRIDGPREISLLRPDLGPTAELGEQERDDVVAAELVPLLLVPEALGDLLGEQAGVVAEPAHGARGAADAVLPQAGGALHRVPGEVDACERRALPVRRQRGDPAVGDGAEAELPQVLERRAEAGRRDGRVRLDGDRPGTGRAGCVEPVAAALRALDPLDGGVERERAAAPGRVLERLEVAHADGCVGEDGGLHRPRRDEEDLTRPRLQAVGDLEAGVALADDEDALALELARGGGLRVVRDLLDSGDGRLPRVGDAEGEDDCAAAVLAVRCDEHVAAFLLARGLPPAAVASLDAAPLRERSEPALHLRARRSHVGAVHLGRDGRPQLGLVGDQAVVVVPLVLAGGALVRRVRLRPGEQPLVDRPLAEHAAGRVVLRDDRVLDAEPRECVGGLQAARPAADDDDRILAGRVSSL